MPSEAGEMVQQRPNPVPPKPRRRRGFSLEPARPKRAERGPDPVAEEFNAKLHHCEIHAIDYYVFELAQDICPACASDSKVVDLEIALKASENHRESLVSEVERLQRLVNFVAAMRDAVGLCDTEDLTWLKAVMYRWRASRSVKLRAIGVAGKHPNGLMAVPTHGDPEAREMTSVGGVVLAGYVKEMVQSLGPEDTMSHLARAMYAQLKGGTG